MSVLWNLGVFHGDTCCPLALEVIYILAEMTMRLIMKADESILEEGDCALPHSKKTFQPSDLSTWDDLVAWYIFHFYKIMLSLHTQSTKLSPQPWFSTLMSNYTKTMSGHLSSTLCKRIPGAHVIVPLNPQSVSSQWQMRRSSQSRAARAFVPRTGKAKKKVNSVLDWPPFLSFAPHTDTGYSHDFYQWD